MKRFVFRLQRVLDYRSRIRDEKRQELVRANFERDEAVKHLEHLQEELANLSSVGVGTEGAIGSPNSSGSFRQEAPPSIPIANFELVNAYGARLRVAIEKQNGVVAEASKKAERAREVYIDSSKDVQALESLHDKRRSDHTEAMLKEQEQALDETTVQRFRRA